MNENQQVLPNVEEVKIEMTPIPGFDRDKYMAHCPSGNVYSFIKGKWLGGKKGTGDDSKYLMTKLTDMEGKVHNMYLSEIIMSSHMGVEKSYWRSMGLEVDHIDNNKTKDNSISNLRLVTSAENKANSKDRNWNKIRLSLDVAKQLREEFKQWTGSKIDWYRMKGVELGVTSRSIQNIILGYTYKEATE
jgi:hypothetical protein